MKAISYFNSFTSNLSLLSKQLNKINVTSSLILKNNCFFFSRYSKINPKSKSNYEKYLENQKEIKNHSQNTVQVSQSNKVKEIQVNPSQDYEINTLKLTPYFENSVKSEELNYETLTYPPKESIKRGAKTPNRKLNKKQLRFLKKVKIIKEYVKRSMHDSSLYRNNISEEDLIGHNDLLKRAMSIDNASIKEFRQARLIEIRKLFSKHERDTGSPAIQACALNEQVLHMVAHLKSHPNDTTSKLRLCKISTKRRRYMMYLKRQDYNTYAYILKYYGLKEFPDSKQRYDPLKDTNFGHR